MPTYNSVPKPSEFFKGKWTNKLVEACAWPRWPSVPSMATFVPSANSLIFSQNPRINSPKTIRKAGLYDQLPPGVL